MSEADKRLQVRSRIQGGLHIVVYGKGGIGKTTIATNLAEALHDSGKRVMLVGCSPKSSLIDVYNLQGKIMPILEVKRRGGSTTANVGEKCIWNNDGILMAETGGPEPGIGCAGVGLPTAFNELKKYSDATNLEANLDVSIYDVIGDVVCGGFATPLRGGGRKVLVVSSGELMSLYAANNIARAVKMMTRAGSDVELLGMIANLRGVHQEDEIIKTFSEMTKIPILAHIPRDPVTFKQAESLGGTVVRKLPESEIAKTFQQITEYLVNNSRGADPEPFEQYDDLFAMFMSFQQNQNIEVGETVKPYLERIPETIVTRDKPKRVSVYGTGGIGKSTTSSNVSAALVLHCEKVLQIGCDPKRDSIANLCGELKPTVLDTLKDQGVRGINSETFKKLIYEGKGYHGRLFGIECGGPIPGRGCAGKGVDTALKYLEQFKAIEEYEFTFVLYDVLGDTVCGGFANPLKSTPFVYIVTSGEVATMIQALKIAQSVDAVRRRGEKTGVAGIINNMRGIPHEQEIVQQVFAAVGLPVLAHIPRSPLVQLAENLRSTVVHEFPESDQAECYLQLAKHFQDNEQTFSLSRDLLSIKEILEIVKQFSAAEAV